MTRRKTIRTRSEADSIYHEVQFDLARKKRKQRATRNHSTNQAYWDNLSVRDRKRIAKGFRNGEKKKLIARAIGYPYSFIVYCWEHHHADLCTS
jgi:hypothetical protein